LLKGIHEIITPELLDVLMRAGHGDEIVIADANFPADSVGKQVVRQNGVKIPQLLDAVCALFPLDASLSKPVVLMQPPPDIGTPEIWDLYTRLLSKHYTMDIEYEKLARFDFYDRASKAFAVVTTSELTRFANIILRKGVIVAGMGS